MAINFQLAQHEVLGTRGQLLTFTIGEALEAIAALRDQLAPAINKPFMEFWRESFDALLEKEPHSFKALLEIDKDDLYGFLALRTKRPKDRYDEYYFRNKYGENVFDTLETQYCLMDKKLFSATDAVWRIRQHEKNWQENSAIVEAGLKNTEKRIYYNNFGKDCPEKDAQPSPADVLCSLLGGVLAFSGLRNYNPNRLFLEKTEDTNVKEHEILLRRLRSLKDTNLMLDTALEFGTRIQTKKVIDPRVIEDIECGRIDREGGDFCVNENEVEPNNRRVIRIFHPRPNGQDILSFGFALLALAHELRHAARHHHPAICALWPPRDKYFSARTLDYFRTKIQEAEAFTFHAFATSVLLSEAERVRLPERFKQHIVYFETKLKNNAKIGMGRKKAMAAALADTFIDNLTQQKAYDDEYSDCLKSPNFAVTWRQLIDGLDMDLLEKLTDIRRIGGSYIKADDPSAKNRIQAVLLKVIPSLDAERALAPEAPNVPQRGIGYEGRPLAAASP